MKLSSAAILAATLILLPLPLLALDGPTALFDDAQQENPSDNSPDQPSNAIGSEQETTNANPYLPGEQLLGLNIGLQIPSFILPKTGGGASNLSLGGNFSFDYQYFISRGFSLGGDIAASYNSTIGGLSVFILPLGMTASYWWSKLPFEFTVFGEGGIYMMRENAEGIFDPFARAGIGAYWRVSSGWSVGVQPSFWFIPEIHYGNWSNLTQFGGFIDTALSAVYHL
jgi:hypothetical protein